MITILSVKTICTVMFRLFLYTFMLNIYHAANEHGGAYLNHLIFFEWMIYFDTNCIMFELHACVPFATIGKTIALLRLLIRVISTISHDLENYMDKHNHQNAWFHIKTVRNFLNVYIYVVTLITCNKNVSDIALIMVQ